LRVWYRRPGGFNCWPEEQEIRWLSGVPGLGAAEPFAPGPHSTHARKLNLTNKEAT